MVKVQISTGTAPIGTANVNLLAGTAEIGKIAAGTATIGNVGVIAGSANVGFIHSTEQGGLYRFGSVVTTAQYAAIALTTSVNAIIVTSVAAKQIVLLSGVIAASPAMKVQFFSAATTLSGPIDVLAGTPVTLPQNRDGWMVSTAGQSLTLTPTVSGNVGGFVSFIVV